MTASLLNSSGRSAAKHLKQIAAKPDSSLDGIGLASPYWGPEVRSAAGRLLRCWRFVANESADDNMMSITDTINSPVVAKDPSKSRPETAGGSASKEKDGKSTVNRNLGAGKGNEKGDKEEGAAETDRGDNSKPNRNSKKPRRDSSGAPEMAKPCTSPTLPPPERPRLIPLLLWDRLSLEFNPSQLRAVWAAVATVRETQLEREREQERVRRWELEKNAVLTSSKVADSSPSAQLASSNDPTGDGGGGPGDGSGGTRGALGEGGVVLLQGPPGTGKTRTVLGVVSAILARDKEKAPGTGAAGTGDGRNGLGMTLEVRPKQKRPGGAARLAAPKTHQRVSVRSSCFSRKGQGWSVGSEAYVLN